MWRYLHEAMSNRLMDKIFFIEKIDQIKILQAKILHNQIKQQYPLLSINDAEFQVFSQFGEDGIIQYLIDIIPIENDIFIEFGVGDYREANTRFLLANNNWKGLVIDCDVKCIDKIKNDPIYWKYDLTAIHQFITQENINSIFLDNGIEGDIGILSIDVDGNDYWIWKSIEVVDPQIVVCEYNSIFGTTAALTIPYSSNFDRKIAHSSHLYFGASIKALIQLADSKGYSFIGCNNAGNNAFFIKKEYSHLLNIPKLEEGYKMSKFREARDEYGTLIYTASDDRIEIIEDLPIFNVETGSIMKIKDTI